MSHLINHRNIVLWIVIVGLINISFAEKSTNRWKCTGLLDPQTQSQLAGREKFFDELFQFPSEYKNASASEKKKLEKQWVKELNDSDREKATLAAANLGIVKSKPAARYIEKAVIEKGGRFRWVCTRSLGQIGAKSSIPVLIDLLDNQQKDSQIYARVSLAEIAGIYFGDDKREWQEWAGLPVDSTVTAETSDSNGPNANEKLQTAREMLRGTDKNTVEAQRILLELADNPGSLSPAPLCYVYVYLGYIEDLANNRQAAMDWFKKAVELETVKQNGIYSVAEQGLTAPVTHLNHLDGQTGNSWTGTVRTVRKASVSKNRPEEFGTPKMNLSATERLENFEALAEAIDQYYSFFDYKNIDWLQITTEYRQKIERAKTSTEFYRILYQFVRELQDAHSRLCSYDNIPKLGPYTPPVVTRLIEGQLTVTNVLPNSEAYDNGLRPGVIITGIDGKDVPEKIEQIRPFIKMVSSERSFREEAYRRILCGPKGSDVTVRFFMLDGQTKIVRLERTVSYKKMAPKPDFPVTKQEYIWDGIHPSGCGYIRIVSFGGKQQGAEEFDKALERLKNTSGLILDVRDNPGGFGAGQEQIIGRFITESTNVNIVYKKNGPGHNDFAERHTYYEPKGTWQYTKPVILLMDSFTGSASDLFVCSLASTGRVVTMGTSTHGNLSGTSVYVHLPCDLVVRVSAGYICDAAGNIIERNGNVPMIHAALTIADIRNGTDSVIDRAAEQLQLQETILNKENLKIKSSH